MGGSSGTHRSNVAYESFLLSFAHAYTNQFKAALSKQHGMVHETQNDESYQDYEEILTIYVIRYFIFTVW
jgi:hypothetical protein